MTYSMRGRYAIPVPCETVSIQVMRIPVAFVAAAAVALAAAPAAAQDRGHGRHGHDRDQDAAFHAMQQGQIMPLRAILTRIQIPGARYIGAELDNSGSVYRLKFMRGGEVIWIDVEARTGRVLGRVR